MVLNMGLLTEDHFELGIIDVGPFWTRDHFETETIDVDHFERETIDKGPF